MDQSEKDLLKQVELLFAKKKFPKIIDILPDNLLEQLGNATLFSYKSISYSGIGQIAKALLYANSAIEIDPSDAMGHLARGNARRENKEYDDAIKDYTKALELNENYAIAYMSRGHLRYELKEYDKALDDYLNGIQLDPNNSIMFFQLGNVYKNKKEYDKAIENYTRAIELNSNYAVAYNSRAILLKNNKDYLKATQDYNTAINLDSNNSLFYFNRGILWHDQKDYDKAISDYSKAIELNKNYANAYNNRGNAWRRKNEIDKAIDDYNKAIKIGKGSPLPYNNRGIVWYEKKEYTKAIKEYTKAIKLDDKYADAYYNRALAFNNLNKYQKAIDDYEQYFKLKDSNGYFPKISISEIEKLKEKIANKWFDEIDQLINEIKELLLFKEECITHYTSLSGAMAMILENSAFRLSEGAFLNDTSEGTELLKYLSFDISKSHNDSVSIPFIEKPFIGSFVAEDKHNDLTLWRMYGKENQVEAKGCALTLKKEKFISSLKTKMSPDDIEANAISQGDDKFIFYNVAYKNNKNDFFLPDESNNPKLNELLKKLKEKINRLNKEQKTDVAKLLNGIAYLFKSVEYQYENEVRLVIDGVGFDKKIEKDFPALRVYIELVDIVPILQKITLGPKVEKAEELAAAFNYHIREKYEKVEIVISILPFK